MKDMKIATVYMGYADGLPNHIKDGTVVKINNQDARVFGKVSMDVTTLDVSNINDCKIEDWCEFFSPNHSINNLARLLIEWLGEKNSHQSSILQSLILLTSRVVTSILTLPKTLAS